MAYAATTYTTTALWAQVGASGHVNVGATVKVSNRIAAQNFDICVKSSSGATLVYPGMTRRTLGTSSTVNQTARAFDPGTYTYWACLQKEGKRQDLSTRKTFTVAAKAKRIANLPGQPALTAYGSSSAASAFSKPGALIIAGRDQYNEKPFRDAGAHGATVLIYLDAIIDNPYGRYHRMLNRASECGPAASRWPGKIRANSYGYLNDFRRGSVVQRKLNCVLEKMVAENPHMGGFFMDDLGSRSWYPGFSWNKFSVSNKRAYRLGAISVAQTAHRVAAKHGLMVMVNGTWSSGSLASSGGGYPRMHTNGLALADGGYIEHHSRSELRYFTGYAKGQWGTASGAVAQGKAFMYVQASDDATRIAYARTGVFAFLSTQREYDKARVWGRFHPTGLPSRVQK